MVIRELFISTAVLEALKRPKLLLVLCVDSIVCILIYWKLKTPVIILGRLGHTVHGSLSLSLSLAIWWLNSQQEPSGLKKKKKGKTSSSLLYIHKLKTKKGITLREDGRLWEAAAVEAAVRWWWNWWFSPFVKRAEKKLTKRKRIG